MAHTVAVTGASGFVGRSLTDHLRDRELAVRAVGRAGRAGQSVAATEFVAVESLTPEPLAAAFDGCDAIVHLAAHIPRDHRDPAEATRCLEVNATGTLAVLQAAVSAGVGHVVYASSANAYRPDLEQAGEADALYPDGHGCYYLTSKVAGELYCSHAGATSQLTTTIVRLTSVYGPAMAQGFVRIAYDRLRGGDQLVVTDGGQQRADFVHVDDVAAGIAAVVEQGAGGAFNLGSGRSTTMSELARLMACVLSVDPGQVVVEPPTGTLRRGFAPVSINRARSMLGYAPRELREGLGTLIADWDTASASGDEATTGGAR